VYFAPNFAESGMTDLEAVFSSVRFVWLAQQATRATIFWAFAFMVHTDAFPSNQILSQIRMLGDKPG